MYALVPLTKRSFRQGGTEGSPCVGLDSGGPAVVGSLGPLRPVTLRRHLSMALPLAESRRELADQMTPNLLSIPQRPSSSCRRQEVDRVHDRYGLHTVFRTEIDRLDAAHDLSG